MRLTQSVFATKLLLAPAEHSSASFPHRSHITKKRNKLFTHIMVLKNNMGKKLVFSLMKCYIRQKTISMNVTHPAFVKVLFSCHLMLVNNRVLSSLIKQELRPTNRTIYRTKFGSSVCCAQSSVWTFIYSLCMCQVNLLLTVVIIQTWCHVPQDFTSRV